MTLRLPWIPDALPVFTSWALGLQVYCTTSTLRWAFELESFYSPIIMIQIYNPSHLGGWERRTGSPRPAWAASKTIPKTRFYKEKLTLVQMKKVPQKRNSMVQINLFSKRQKCFLRNCFKFNKDYNTNNWLQKKVFILTKSIDWFPCVILLNESDRYILLVIIEL